MHSANSGVISGGPTENQYSGSYPPQAARASSPPVSSTGKGTRGGSIVGTRVMSGTLVITIGEDVLLTAGWCSGVGMTIGSSVAVGSGGDAVAVGSGGVVGVWVGSGDVPLAQARIAANVTVKSARDTENVIYGLHRTEIRQTAAYHKDKQEASCSYR